MSISRVEELLRKVLPLILVSFASLALASESLIVVSSNAVPYLAAQTAIEERLSGMGYTSHSVDLVDFSLAGLDSSLYDVAIAVGTAATALLYQRLPSAVPLVYCLVGDPAAAGLDASRPIHGICATVPVETQFALIAEALPKVRKIGMLYRASDSAGRERVERVRSALPQQWRLEDVAIDDHDNVARAIAHLLAQDIDIVWTAVDRSVYDESTIRYLLLAALRHQVPVFGYSIPFVRAGALLGLGVEPRQQGIEAANEAYRLAREVQMESTESNANHKLHLAEPAFKLAVNSAVAVRLSIDLPQTLLDRAAYDFGSLEEHSR